MDLTTAYLGMELANPLVPSSSPFSQSLDSARELEDAGAAAIIMHSLFAEAIEGDESGGPRALANRLEPYLEQLAALKKALGIPVIASLNAATPGAWLEHARQLQDTGADAVELNVYHVAANAEESGAQVEARYLELLRELRRRVSVPINMKLSPAFSSLPHMVSQLESTGAQGVSLFNRFYQPDIDTANLCLAPSLHPSSSGEALLAMRWIAILYGRTGLSLGATGGVQRAEDAVKLLLAGADVVHLCSALLTKGPEYLGEVLRGVTHWLEQNGFESITAVRGRVSQSGVADPSAFERANYVGIIDSYSFGPGIDR